MKTISFVIPSYNEEENIIRVYHALKNAVPEGYDYEFLYVDNASHDDSRKVFSYLVGLDKKVRAIRYSRNFGYQNAMMGGIDHATGDCVICIDGDLQDPPELIPEFIRKWEDGFDVVYGIRKSRDGNRARNLFYKLFYRLINRLSDVYLPVDVGEFGLMDRSVYMNIRRMSESNVYIRGLRAWCGYRQTGIEYKRREREFGSTKFNFWRNLTLAVDGITGFSIKPLSLIFYTGFFCILLSILLIIYSFSVYFFFPQFRLAGWASLLTTVVFFGGIQLFSIGILGEYIGRIFLEIKNRPKYIVDEIIEDKKPKDDFEDIK